MRQSAMRTVSARVAAGNLGVKPMNFSQRSSGPFCAALVLAVATIGGASQAFAGTIKFPEIAISIEGNPAPAWNYSPSAGDYRQATGGGYELSGSPEFDILNNWAHMSIESLQWDPDPFVLNNVLVTNTTTATQIFSVFVGLPTTFAAPNSISGNVRTSVIDGGDDGATVATVASTALYQAQIDAVTVATLHDHPFSLIAPSAGSNTAFASFGPLLSGIPVTSTIGIQLRFSLSAGDTASILSRFDVVEARAVPDVGSSATMVAIAMPLFLAMSARSRRRKARPGA